MDLFDKLFVIRRLLSLSQKEAAEQAGIKQPIISILERGERDDIPTAYIEFLYKSGIDLNWVFNEDTDVANVFRKKATTY